MSFPAAATCRPAVTRVAVMDTVEPCGPVPEPRLTRTTCGVKVAVDVGVVVGVAVLVGVFVTVGVAVLVAVRVGVLVGVAVLVAVAVAVSVAVAVAVSVGVSVGVSCAGARPANRSRTRTIANRGDVQRLGASAYLTVPSRSVRSPARRTL
jgi:hypothetical protein